MFNTYPSPCFRGIVSVTALVAFCSLAQGQILPSETPREDFWLTDGEVNDVAKLGDTLFVGGLFNYVGPKTGGAILANETGHLIPGFPEVEGVVHAVTPDGAGGWFVGGEFAMIGGVARVNLAHVLPNGSVSTVNLPTNGPVHALTRADTTVYIGGAFSTVGNQARASLAAVNASNGQLTSWNPGTDGTVYALHVVAGAVYIGGEFDFIQGQVRRNLASVSSDGFIMPFEARAVSTDASITARVNAITSSANTIYVGGRFDRITYRLATFGGILVDVDRNNLVAFGTGGSSIPLDWAPETNGEVHALLHVAPRVYIGGSFQSVNDVSRFNLAAVGNTSGVLSDWHPSSLGGPVRALAFQNPYIYAGGEFTSFGGAAGYARLGRAHYLSGAIPIAKVSGANRPIHALAFQDGELFIGGSFTSAGGQRRQNLAALDAENGHDLGMDIDASSFVQVLEAHDDAVYVGGAFNTLGGLPRQKLAALQNSVEEPVLSWAPTANSTVFTMAITEDRIYIGGAFTQVNSQSRSYIASFVGTTETLSSWNPNAGNFVNIILPTNLAIFAGGRFNSIGGQDRNLLAALDPSTGNALPFNPFVQGTAVFGLALAGDNLYFGGSFQGVGGTARQNIAAVHRGTGALLDWNPSLDGIPYTVVSRQGVVYAGGLFALAAGQPRNNVTAFSGTDTQNPLLPWNPASAISPNRLRVIGDSLFTVGSAGSTERHILAYDFPTGPPPNPFDINGDGFVNAVDVQLVINAALGLSIAPFNADVNGDGNINAVDVQQVINAALGIV